MNLTGEQKKTILAAYLGWMLDAFDFFLLTFLLKDIAKEFGVDVPAVAYALFLTLAMRFVGAFIFGRLGDRWGRKPALMLDILCYSIVGALAAFSPNLTSFWSCARCSASPWAANGASAARSRWNRSPRRRAASCPASCNAAIPRGFLLAAIAYGLLYGRTFGDYYDRLAGDVPAQRPARFRRAVHPQRRPRIARVRGVEGASEAAPVGDDFRQHWGLVIYMVVLMMCFNLFSHGTQDLYPTFLQKQHNFDPATVSWIVIVANLGAIAGGLRSAICRSGSAGSTRSPSPP